MGVSCGEVVVRKKRIGSEKEQQEMVEEELGERREKRSVGDNALS